MREPASLDGARACPPKDRDVSSDSTSAPHWMHMYDEAALIEKLRKIETLFARPGTDGERAAAANARERIRARLRELERVEAPIEYRFAIHDPWSRTLLTALLRRYELTPYRYRGQRRTTLMVKVTQTFVDDTLWPEILEADRVLREYLGEVTQRVIADAVSRDATDVEERVSPTPAGGPGPREQRVLDAE
jgi:hypothetical protein